MNIRHYLCLSLAALCFTTYACSEDSSDESDQGQSQQNDHKDQDNKGKQDNKDTNKVCAENAWQCSDNKLEQCVSDAWKTQKTCENAALCNAKDKRCDECSGTETTCTKIDGKDTITWCNNGLIEKKECVSGCDGNACPDDLCPNDPNKTAPGVCGCGFEDKDIDNDGKIDCPVKTIPDGILPDLPDIEGTCAEWSYPKHPKIEFPDLPEYSYETTIDIKKYNISNVYDVSKAKETTQGFAKAIEDAKNAGYTRIVIPDGHYPIGYSPEENFTEGLYMQDGIALIMSDNVILQMIPTNTYDCNIINLRKRANIYIEGGVLIGEKSQHTLSESTTTDEECNGITSYYSNHILINKTKFKSAHGDGILIFDYKPDNQVSNNFIIANCEFDDNFRQGISVVGVDGVRISNNEIHHTSGTDPQFGIDFEGAGRVNKNVIVDHNYFHDNVGGDVIIDSYNTFLEYNRFSVGDMEKYVDNPFIPRGKSSYIMYRNNFEKFTYSVGCGYSICCSYGTDMNQEFPSFFVENEITHTRLMLTNRNKVCIKDNVVHEGHLSASTITDLRLFDNRVEHYTPDAVYGSFSVQNVRGKASGNMRCSAPDACTEAAELNEMSDDKDLTTGANFW